MNAGTVVAMLSERGKTVGTAESCTGGLIAKLITDIPGASRCFLGGIVAYTPQVKIEMAGVSRDTIKRSGVVSRDTALALARGARERLNTDFGVGVTGVAGPGADGDSNPPGLVYIAVSAKEGGAVSEFRFGGTRESIREQAAEAALQMLFDCI